MGVYKYFVNPFGEAGDITPAVPDQIQSDGSISYAQGWGPFFELELGIDPDALPISRPEMNRLFYDITLALQQYQQLGTPNFITTSQNLGSPFPYKKRARCIYNDGGGDEVYESLVDNNTALPTDSTKWKMPSLAEVPTGAIMMLGNDTSTPPGYVAMDHGVLNRVTYAGLFAFLGIVWGAGDGATTFNVPGSARQVFMGSGGTGDTRPGGVPGTWPGALGGERAHTPIIDEMANHDHPGSHITNGTTTTAQGGSGNTDYTPLPPNTNPPVTVAAQGGGLAFNITQLSSVVYYVMKY